MSAGAIGGGKVSGERGLLIRLALMARSFSRRFSYSMYCKKLIGLTFLLASWFSNARRLATMSLISA